MNNRRGDIIKLIVIFLLIVLIIGEVGFIIRTNRIHKRNEMNNSIETSEDAQGADGETADAAAQPAAEPGAGSAADAANKPIVVLDPGHGKPSSLMSAEEKAQYGWKQNAAGAWGEWRHYKIGSGDIDCEGTGCNHRVTPNGACWYPIGNSDRATEPEINLNNALAAKKHLEEMGYAVRITRSSDDENPSITRRLEYCYPNMDKTQPPDAELFLCIHSNAGGGRGSAYIQSADPYDQKWISPSYSYDSNRLGQLVNDRIVNTTSLTSSGPITFEPELIAFCKAPVTCGYLEIGFFDTPSDLAILQSESDGIGRAIAEGIDQFLSTRQ